MGHSLQKKCKPVHIHFDIFQITVFAMPLCNYVLVNTLVTFDLENVSRCYIGALTQRCTIKRTYFIFLLSRSRWFEFKLAPRIPGIRKRSGLTSLDRRESRKEEERKKKNEGKRRKSRNPADVIESKGKTR